MPFDLIIFIVKTAASTLLLIAGIALIVVSHEKWERIIGRLIGVSDLEISTGAVIFRRILGGALVALAVWLTYFLFIAEN